MPCFARLSVNKVEDLKIDTKFSRTCIKPSFGMPDFQDETEV